MDWQFSAVTLSKEAILMQMEGVIHMVCMQ